MLLLTMFSSDYYFYIGNEIETLWSDKGLCYNPRYFKFFFEKYSGFLNFLLAGLFNS